MTAATADIAFVRKTLTDAKAPPSSIVGPVAWMRHHLFGSIPDALLTVFGVALVGWIVWTVADFAILRAVWTGSNGEACRAEGVGA